MMRPTHLTLTCALLAFAPINVLAQSVSPSIQPSSTPTSQPTVTPSSLPSVSTSQAPSVQASVGIPTKTPVTKAPTGISTPPSFDAKPGLKAARQLAKLAVETCCVASKTTKGVKGMGMMSGSQKMGMMSGSQGSMMSKGTKGTKGSTKTETKCFKVARRSAIKLGKEEGFYINSTTKMAFAAKYDKTVMKRQMTNPQCLTDP